MSGTSSADRFYRLIYFLPRPEDEERICVGILVNDSGRLSLVYDDRFEKARCIAPDYTAESLKFILDTLREKAEGSEFGRLALTSSPQFQLSEPRVLLQAPNEQVREILRRRFLVRVRPSRNLEREKGVGRKIDHLLGKIQVSASHLKRRPSFSALFGSEALQSLPHDLVPKSVLRAITFDNKVVLLDGVDLHAKSTDALVNSVGRIGHVFWQYQAAKGLSIALSGTKLIRTALLFNGDGRDVSDAIKWRRDYAHHELQKDTELMLEPGEMSAEEKLRGILRPLLPNPRPIS
jgi:hypothetical protein